MTPVPGIWRGRAVTCVTCRDVTCRACDVARDRSIGPDLGEEKPVAKENPAKNHPSPVWARPAIHGASWIYIPKSSCNILKIGAVLVHMCKLLFA